MKSFTLIETLVAVAVFTLAIGALASFILMAYRTQGYGWQQSLAINEARRGIETMVKEIREAREGGDGSYPIEKAGDKEFIFYSDIDQDDQVERVRYFLGTLNSGSQAQTCVTFAAGGSCSVSFSNFLSGTLTSAEIKGSTEGDLGSGNEYAEVFADGRKLKNFCQTGCSDCAGVWQDTSIFDVTDEAADNSVQFLSDATSWVGPYCDWQEPSHSLKTKFELSFTEELAGLAHEFKRGVIEPVGFPVEYPLDQENISALSSYVRNAPPIFEYFDQDGLKIVDYPARLTDTKLMKVFLVVNINPARPPSDFGLESFVQLRNLKEE